MLTPPKTASNKKKKRDLSVKGDSEFAISVTLKDPKNYIKKRWLPIFSHLPTWLNGHFFRWLLGAEAAVCHSPTGTVVLFALRNFKLYMTSMYTAKSMYLESIKCKFRLIQNDSKVTAIKNFWALFHVLSCRTITMNRSLVFRWLSPFCSLNIFRGPLVLNRLVKCAKTSLGVWLLMEIVSWVPTYPPPFSGDTYLSTCRRWGP